jgi:hypothetical protein
LSLGEVNRELIVESVKWMVGGVFIDPEDLLAFRVLDEFRSCPFREISLDISETSHV